MSYPPFAPGHGNHPYPPSLSYPTAPPPNPSAPAYPPAAGGMPHPPSTPGFAPPPYPVPPYPSSVAGSYFPSPSPVPYPVSNVGAHYPPFGSAGFPVPGSDSVHSPIYSSLSSNSYATPPLNSSPRHANAIGYGGGGQMRPETNPTVRPWDPFYPRQDAEILRKAMKGFGTDETTIISILTKRTNFQRQEIAKEFKTLYGKDLVKDLKSETSGHFEDLLVALMTPLPEFYARELNHAIAGIGTTESTLIEVLCTLSNAELGYIKAEYERLYRNSLEDDLASDTSGNFKRLLRSLCQGRRDESVQVNTSEARADAQALLRAGELRFGTDESTFNAILCSRSFAQLGAIFREYESLTGHGFEKAVKSEFSGDIEDGLMAIVKCVKNRAEFLAECLHKSMAGMGTRDRDLIRIIVTRSEIDLADVKRAFNDKYGKSLESFVKGDTSGDYKKCLLALLE